MTRYSLDTNILSGLFKDPDGPVEKALRARENEDIGVSLIVKGELLFGLKKNKNLRGLRQFEVFLETIPVWNLEAPVEERYAELRVAMEREGFEMDPNDLWIASQAVAMGAVVVTDDKAFARVPGLVIENWLRE